MGTAMVAAAVQPAVVAAQRRPDTWNVRVESIVATPLRIPEAFQSEGEPATGTMVAAGTLGAAVGFFGGAWLGYRLERSAFPCRCDDPGFMGLIVGASIGSALTVPLFVHAGNRGRGSLARDLGVSLLVGGVGLAGLLTTIDSETGLLFLFGAPVVEIIATVLTESAATRERR